MTIADELQHYNDGLIDAYDAVDAKGGTIPQNKNLDNLPTAIGSISGGGGGAPDPVEVYNQTRPADWLKMPEIGDNEDNVIYLLLHVASTTTEDTKFQYSVSCNSSSGDIVWEFGTTDSAGVFTPNSALTYTAAASTAEVVPDITLSSSAFTNATSSGKKQLICKVYTTAANIKAIRGSQGFYYNLYGLIVEAKCKATSATSLGYWGNQTLSSSLTYFSMKGTNQVTSGTPFQNCVSLQVVLELDTSHFTNFGSMFYSCYSLLAIPTLDTSSGTGFNSMFIYCYSLSAIPLLDTSSGTNFSQMFRFCYSLTTIPLLDTSSGTDFDQMFSNCYSLTTIPLLNTSSGTNFNQMLYNCYTLTTIPLLDTSSGTNFNQMFSNCFSLKSVPLLNTSSGIYFSSMFSGCRGLTSIPQIDTSSGTVFSSMFASCSALTDLDFTWLDMSHVTTAYYLDGIWSNVLIGGTVLELGDNWPSGGIIATNTLVSVANSNFINASNPAHIKINKTDAMLPIAVNATVLFSNIQYIYVYVPDALLATYQADAYWATLGARLKGFSDLPS